MSFVVTTSSNGPAPAAPAVETPPAETPTEKPPETPGETPQVAAEKPGRAAAAAKRMRTEAEGKIAEADRKANEVKASTGKYEEAIKSGDVDKILEAFGIDDEKLVDLYIAKHGKTEEGEAKKADGEIRKEIDALKAEIAESKQREETARTSAEVQRVVAQLEQAANAGGDAYELVNTIPTVSDPEFGAITPHQAAFLVQVRYNQQTGKRISDAEALAAVEEQLEVTARAEYERLSKLKKFGGKTAEAAKSDPAPVGDGLDGMRAAFKAARPRVTNGTTTSLPASSARPRTRADADARFRERVAAAIGRPSN